MPKHTKLGDSAEIYQPRKEQTEKEKLRDMSFQGKVAYLWEYYRYYAFATIVAIIFAVYLVHSILTPKIETKFYAAIINNNLDTKVLDDYQQSFADHLQLDPKKEDVKFNSTFYLNSPNSMDIQQALSTFIAAQEIDVIIAPESDFKNYAYYGFFDKMSDQLPTDLYSSLTDDFYLSDKEDDTEKSVYGIYLRDSNLYNNSTNTNEPYVIGIITNSKHKENAVEFIRYLFQSNVKVKPSVKTD